MRTLRTPAVLLALALGCATAPEYDADAVRLGRGEQRYAWVDGWLKLPPGEELGNTHGEVVVASDGRVVLNTDTERAVMVFAPDGTLLDSWGADLANGMHGMSVVREDGRDVLYFAHWTGHEFGAATLDGEILWTQGYPEESGVYASAEEFRPTSLALAPDGRLYVADGYGKSWVHVYDADRRYLKSFGGPGKEPGKMNTPHGVLIDTRGEEPLLVVADRENHRLQFFDLDGNFQSVVEGMLRRPCKIQQQGDYLVVPDLAGRVTVLDKNNELYVQLGDNPDESQWANNGVPRDAWQPGIFLAPHSAAWDARGNLYVMDWNATGRVNKLARVRE